MLYGAAHLRQGIICLKLMRLILDLFLSLSNSLFVAHTRTLALTCPKTPAAHTRIRNYPSSHKCSEVKKGGRKNTHTYTPTHTHPLSPLSLPLTLSHAHTYPPIHSLSLSLSLSHTHTHTRIDCNEVQSCVE